MAAAVTTPILDSRKSSIVPLLQLPYGSQEPSPRVTAHSSPRQTPKQGFLDGAPFVAGVGVAGYAAPILQGCASSPGSPQPWRSTAPGPLQALSSSCTPRTPRPPQTLGFLQPYVAQTDSGANVAWAAPCNSPLPVSARGAGGTPFPPFGETHHEAELRAKMVARDAKVQELEKQLDGAWQLVESSVPVSRLQDTKVHFEALLAEREHRLEAQARILDELRRTVEEQHAELVELRKASGRRAGGTSTSAKKDMHAPDLRWPTAGERTDAVRANGSDDVGSPVPPLSPWPPRQDANGSHPSSPRAAAKSANPASAPPTSATSVAAAATAGASLVPSFGSPPVAPPAQSSSPPASSRSFAMDNGVEDAAINSAPASARVWASSDIIRVGDDQIDKEIRRYFEQHLNFQVFTNKLQTGLYTFGKPVQLKVYMKMAAGEVVVRIKGKFKRLDRWLDEFRREAEAADGEEAEMTRDTRPSPSSNAD